MAIRRFHPDDAPQIVNLFQRSVLELAVLFYSEEQAKAWAARGPDLENILSRNQDGRITCVSVNESSEVMAYAELERDGHIDQVYAMPEAAGSDVVSELYDYLENIARELSIKTLYTEASEGARRFFLKKEFLDRGRRDFEIEGVTIHNYAMDKSL